MKILLVDDNPIDMMITQAELENLNQEVICASSGEKAISIFNNESIDLIIMDEIMPGLSGRETVAEIRKHQTGWVPIIFLSATVKPDIILSGIESGGDDYLGKPVNSIILQAKITALSRFANMRQELIHINHEMVEKNKILNQLADHDGLTGLYNRRYLDKFLAMTIGKARRDNESMCLLMIDIDWFKLYNDCYGHVDGDKCIIQVANAMSNIILRETDCLGRYGGEEFCVVLPNTSTIGGMNVVTKLLECIRSLNIVHEQSEYGILSISLGVLCIKPELSDKLDDLYKKADKALYKAKKSGRNTFSLYNKED